MPTLHHPYLLVAGAIGLVIGWLLFRWSGRHDIKGLAIDAAWTAAKSRGKTAMTPEIQAKLDALKSDGSTIGRGKQVAGMAARHFIAQIVGIASYIAMLGGLGMAAAAFWWN